MSKHYERVRNLHYAWKHDAHDEWKQSTRYGWNPNAEGVSIYAPGYGDGSGEGSEDGECSSIGAYNSGGGIYDFAYDFCEDYARFGRGDCCDANEYSESGEGFGGASGSDGCGQGDGEG